MATLVTGAGLIGTAFAAYALARGESVVFLDPEPRADFLRRKLGEKGYTLVRKDVRDLPGLIETIQTHRIDNVVHTAGLIGGRVQQGLSHAFDVNLGGTRNVAETARLTSVRRLVHISTFGVYDSSRPASGPITEDFPCGGTRAYGAYKAAKELILGAYAAAFGFELIMLRPANVFGFGHFWSGSSGGRKMQALLEAGLDDRVARIPSAETMANEYIYAKDMGRAVDLALTVPLASLPPPAQRVFNIGTGAVTPFAEVLETARALFPNLRVEIESGEKPKSKEQPLDISRAKKHLGWEPRYTLHDAFEDYVAELKKARAD